MAQRNLLLFRFTSYGWVGIVLFLMGGTGAGTTIAGPLSWLERLLPGVATPEDPHLYPQGALLYDMWTCKGENEIGWVGVTRQFTDRDPYIVVVVRTEFPEEIGYGLLVTVEIHAPRHNRIIASDRIALRRQQDVGIFYHPQRLAKIGGWGEYTAVLCIDGIPKDQITFRLDRQEDLDRIREEERRKKEAEEAFRKQFLQLEARSLLGPPDVDPDADHEGEAGFSSGNDEQPTPEKPILEVLDPEDWYRTDFTNQEGKIIVFPKKPRKTWSENVKKDLRYRLSYYIYE